MWKQLSRKEQNSPLHYLWIKNDLMNKKLAILVVALILEFIKVSGQVQIDNLNLKHYPDLNSPVIFDFHSDSDGVLWIGTYPMRLNSTDMNLTVY